VEDLLAEGDLHRQQQAEEQQQAQTLANPAGFAIHSIGGRHGPGLHAHAPDWPGSVTGAALISVVCPRQFAPVTCGNSVTGITKTYLKILSYYISASYSPYLSLVFDSDFTAKPSYLIDIYDLLLPNRAFSGKNVTFYDKCAFLLKNVTYIPDMCYYTRRVVEITSGN
jgi:hypothetical protein